MRITGPVRRLTVVVSEGDRYQHHALSTEIVHRAHLAGLAGATVLRGVAGYGHSRTLHTSHVLSLSDELPVTVVVVDEADKIDAFLPSLNIVTSGLVTVEDLEAV